MQAERTRLLYVVRRGLPYHAARLRALADMSAWEVRGIQSVEQDPEYDAVAGPGAAGGFQTAVAGGEPGARELRDIWRAVYEQHRPDVILGPAPAMAECMAAIDHRRARPEVSVIIQDDIWSGSTRLARLNRWARRCIAEQLDAVLVPAGLHAWEYTSLGFPPERVFLGVNAVDVGFWGAGTERDYVERNDFVFVGRLIPTKGVGLLLEAFSELRQEHSEARLHVIGDGEERHRVARGARGDPHVVDTGPLTGRALQERLATARFLVVPSLGDTWAIVVAEAMAAGTPPIVSSATGAAWGLVRNGVNGFVFEAGRREALTAALSRAWALDAAEWSAMSRNAREAVEKEDVSSFAASVGAALRMGRRTSAPSRASRLMTRLWSGHGIGPR